MLDLRSKRRASGQREGSRRARSRGAAFLASSRRKRGSLRLGWTVLEMLIVVVVLAILSGVAVPVYTGYVEKVEIKTAVRDIRVLEGAIDRYRTEFGRPPNQLSGVVEPLLTDPWGNPYEYLRLQGGSVAHARKDKNLNPINSDYDLYSMGKDGESALALTAQGSQDDVVRANDGDFVGLASDY